MPDIVVLGEILVEFVAAERGARLDAESLFVGPFPSGAPAIAADQAALQGASVAMIGPVGADRFGEMCRARLARSGVDVGRIRTDPDAPTASAHVAYDAAGGRDFVFTLKHSAATGLGPADVAEDAFAGARFLLLSGSTLFAPGPIAAVDRAVALARRHGVRLALDLNIREQLLGPTGYARLAALAGGADILFASAEDLEAMARHGAPVDVAALLRAAPETIVLLKAGAEGATLVTAEGRRHRPAIASDEIDPTGAGDAFAATFLAALCAGADTPHALDRAVAAGALAVRRRGPMSGNSTAAEVDALLAGQDGTIDGPAGSA